MAIDQCRGKFVNTVLSSMFNLGVDRFYPLLFVRSLGFTKQYSWSLNIGVTLEKYKVGLMDIRKGRRCVFMLHAHLIFITKYRGKIFTEPHLQTLEKICRGVCSEDVLKQYIEQQNRPH